jgi:hypothetical protein
MVVAILNFPWEQDFKHFTKQLGMHLHITFENNEQCLNTGSLKLCQLNCRLGFSSHVEYQIAIVITFLNSLFLF